MRACATFLCTKFLNFEIEACSNLWHILSAMLSIKETNDLIDLKRVENFFLFYATRNVFVNTTPLVKNALADLVETYRLLESPRFRALDGVNEVLLLFSKMRDPPFHVLKPCLQRDPDFVLLSRCFTGQVSNLLRKPRSEEFASLLLETGGTAVFVRLSRDCSKEAYDYILSIFHDLQPTLVDRLMGEGEASKIEYECPISLFPCHTPVLASDGHCYDLKCIMEHMKTSEASPMNRGFLHPYLYFLKD